MPEPDPPRGPGQPPRVPGAASSVTLTVRVTEGEREQVRRWADDDELSVSDWIRWRLGLGPGAGEDGDDG